MDHGQIARDFGKSDNMLFLQKVLLILASCPVEGTTTTLAKMTISRIVQEAWSTTSESFAEVRSLAVCGARLSRTQKFIAHYDPTSKVCKTGSADLSDMDDRGSTLVIVKGEMTIHCKLIDHQCCDQG